VDIASATSFLSANPRAVLATTRVDGRPQLSPIVVAVDDDGRLLISTRETAIKAKNLARDPRAAVCGLNDSFFGEWVQAEGTAELIHLPAAMPLLEDYYRRISGEHPDWAEYQQQCAATSASLSGSRWTGPGQTLAASTARSRTNGAP
jgi:PPOX class probable F420-dependent enzyme